VLSPSVFVLGFVTALAVGLASGLLPGLGAMRLQIVHALRRV
jgi:ABC-type antimicrobial peptide transport system permease subunit